MAYLVLMANSGQMAAGYLIDGRQDTERPSFHPVPDHRLSNTPKNGLPTSFANLAKTAFKNPSLTWVQ